MSHPIGRVLVIAGSDSGGGAGIQADIKTITLLGGYATTAITALTAQNTQGVTGIHSVPAAFVAQQMQAVLCDIGADIIKTGMLHTRENINVIADMLEKHPDTPLVLDPVMISTSGHKLLEDDAIEVLKTRLAPRAFIITPNLPEAALLLGIDSIENAADAAIALQKKYGCRYVLLKGGHCRGNDIEDILYDGQEIHRFPHQRIQTRHTHGTGCTLASALATFLAKGYAVEDATQEALLFVQKAIEKAPGFGSGSGPLGFHAKTLRRLLLAREVA
jgi:hydroxymethylpyrimidine/phosphomethylpyrimidine kinase